MNKLLRSIIGAMSFDNMKSNNFELLETEYGEPSNCDDQDARRYEPSNKEGEEVFPELDKNLDCVRATYRADISKDLVVREFMLCGRQRAAIVFINGLSDNESINNFILRDGMQGEIPDNTSDVAKYVSENVFTVNDIKLTSKYIDVTRSVMDGLTAIFIDGDTHCCIADTRKYPQRSVSAAEKEKVAFGPQEAFIENIRTNISLIRRHTHTDDLVCEMRTCGEDTKSHIGIMYREGVADSKLVGEIKKRLANIKTRSVISTGIINQMVETNPLSPIPQTLLTEKPDRCAAYLLEGHVVILCDGCPMAAILPVTLFSLLSSPEDVYTRQIIGNTMRVIRYAGALIAITVPGIFIAIFMFHQGFLSAEMLTTLISSRKMVFIPIGLEMLLLLFVFQLVREAGMRAPDSVGQGIGIIGGLVLGQAVVSANLASSIVLILVALTGLGTFCIPDYSTQLSSVYFRVLFVIAGWLGGFLALSCAFLLFVAYLVTLKSFGVPFITPYAPKTRSKRMSILRGPINNNTTRKEDYMQ